MLELAALVFFPALMAYAAASDLLTMTISNRVSIALVAASWCWPMRPACRLPVISDVHLACGAAVLVLTFALFAFGWIGGGDAKLAAATAVWLGWTNLFDYGLQASVLGAGLTLGILYLRKYRLPPELAGPRMDRPAARGRQWCAVRDRARGGRAAHLPRNSGLGGGQRRVDARSLPGRAHYEFETTD